MTQSKRGISHSLSIYCKKFLNISFMVIIDHPQFKALYFSEACSFEVPENGEFVITGGWKGSNHHGIKRVQVYTTTGVKEQLPDMNHARHAHGCSYFHDASGKLVKNLASIS